MGEIVIRGFEDLQKTMGKLTNPDIPKILYSVATKLLTDSIHQNFFEETAPDGRKWDKLSKKTEAGRKKGRGIGRAGILRDTGAMFNSIQVFDPEGDQIYIGIPAGLSTEVIKGLVHQNGRKASGGSMVKSVLKSMRLRHGGGRAYPAIPARSFVGVRPGDQEIANETAWKVISDGVG